MDKRVGPEFERMGMQHIIISSSAHFVERFNMTFKWMLDKRIQEAKLNRIYVRKTTPVVKS